MENTSKTKMFLSMILAPVLAFFDPYIILVKAIGLLVIFDMVSGIIAARKEGKAINSRSLLKKVPQVVLFLFGLAAAKFASPLLQEFGIDAHQAGKWFCALYGLYEFFSVLENLGRMGMPVAKQFTALLKARLPEDMQKLEEVKNDISQGT